MLGIGRLLGRDQEQLVTLAEMLPGPEARRCRRKLKHLGIASVLVKHPTSPYSRTVFERFMLLTKARDEQRARRILTR